jgi:hypothetical protein
MLPLVGGIVAGVRNCDVRAAGARQMLYTRVLPGTVTMWNNMSVGSGVDYYVPRMFLNHNEKIASWQMGHPVSGEDDSGTRGFTSVFYNPSAANYAFHLLSEVPVFNPKTGVVICDPKDEGKDWVRIRANAGPPIPGGAVTKTAVEVGAAAVTVATAATLAYSFATGKAWDFLLRSAWKDVVSFFK